MHDHEHEVCIFFKGWDFNNFIVSIHQCEEITSYSKHPDQRVIDFTIYVEHHAFSLTTGYGHKWKECESKLIFQSIRDAVEMNLCPLWYISYLTNEIYDMTKIVMLYITLLKNEIYQTGH